MGNYTYDAKPSTDSEDDVGQTGRTTSNTARGPTTDGESSRNALSHANDAPSTHRRTSPSLQTRPYGAALHGMNHGAADLDPSSSSAVEAGQQFEPSSSPMNAPGTAARSANNDGTSAIAPLASSATSSVPSRSSSSSSSAHARGTTRSRHDSVVESFSPSTGTGPKTAPRTCRLPPQTNQELMAMQDFAISDDFALE